MRQAGILLAGLPLAKIPSRAKPARELAALPQNVSRSHPLPPATQANYFSVVFVIRNCQGCISIFTCNQKLQVVYFSNFNPKLPVVYSHFVHNFKNAEFVLSLVQCMQSRGHTIDTVSPDQPNWGIWVIIADIRAKMSHLQFQCPNSKPFSTQLNKRQQIQVLVHRTRLKGASIQQNRSWFPQINFSFKACTLF